MDKAIIIQNSLEIRSKYCWWNDRWGILEHYGIKQDHTGVFHTVNL